MATPEEMAKRAESDCHIPELPAQDAAYHVERLLPAEVAFERLFMDRTILDRTVCELQGRSCGWRESGAIWAGAVDGPNSIVQDVFFMHDLCDDQGGAHSLELSEDAKFWLYRELSRRGQKLLGMIHTHPEDWVGLSRVDRANQLCSRIGFWPLVVPFYAQRPWELTTVGVHIRVDPGWYQFSDQDVKERIVIE